MVAALVLHMEAGGNSDAHHVLDRLSPYARVCIPMCACVLAVGTWGIRCHNPHSAKSKCAC